MEKLFGESLCNLLLEWGMFKLFRKDTVIFLFDGQSTSSWTCHHRETRGSQIQARQLVHQLFIYSHIKTCQQQQHIIKCRGKKDTIRGLLCQCKAITYQVWWQNSQAPESWTARGNQIKDVQMWAKWYKWSRTHSSGREISSTCIVLAWTRSPVSNADMSLLTWHPT